MSAIEFAPPTRSAADWRDFAACTGRIQLFFAKVAERPQARQRREDRARKLCDSCAVRSDCRQFARDNHEYGFWGGENEEDRHLAGYLLTAPIGVRVRIARNQAAAS
ncbi:WhiB family transcriptional regulator [Ilumatobacter sp.]|uniref:WhiB family transcriptional regulator n=1 Tax=Ilumatobacter sp. TaxID=1967498 RepID=UPI003C60771F